MSRDTRRPLKAGELKHTVTIRALAGTLAVAESIVATHVPTAISVVPPQFQRSEQLGLGGIQLQTQYQLSLRYREDLEPSYVLDEECCTERRFQIVAIIPSDLRDALDLTCVVAG